VDHCSASSLYLSHLEVHVAVTQCFTLELSHGVIYYRYQMRIETVSMNIRTATIKNCDMFCHSQNFTVYRNCCN
jgi:hypothetical protein